MEDLIEKDPAEDENQGFGGNLRRSRTSISISSIRILTEEEVSRVKTKFHEEIDQVFVEAIRAHVSSNYFLLTHSLFLCRKTSRIRRFQSTFGLHWLGSLLITLLAT